MLSAHIQELRTRRDRTVDQNMVTALTAEISDNEAFQNQLTRTVLHLPSLAFNDRLMIHGSHRSLELVTFGGGHTDSDAFMLIPDEEIVFMGDLVTVRAHPAIMSGDVDEWIRILDRVQTLDIKTVVPGHGCVGTMNDVLATKQYLSDLLNTDAWMSASKNIRPPPPYADWMMPYVFEWNVNSVRKWREKSV